MATYLHDAGMRVAVIESNPVELQYLLALVAGAPGVTATDGYSSLTGALSELDENPPGLVIADLEGDGNLAATWLKQMHTNLPHTAVLVLSTENDRDRLFTVLEAGISGWLQKPYTADQFLRAIAMLRKGGAILSSPVARRILDYFQARGSSVRHLSHHEREILNLMGGSMQTTDIAERLGLSHSRVRSHLRSILLKLKANSRAEAVAKYLNPTV